MNPSDVGAHTGFNACADLAVAVVGHRDSCCVHEDGHNRSGGIGSCLN
jgi:hypothetical protein